MPEYMRALHRRFGKEPQRETMLKDEIDRTRTQMKEHLDRPQRKLLLRLTDQEAELRDEVSLYSFISGYRLACGIHRELSEEPPYSFDQEEEDRAQQFIMNVEEGG